VWKSRLGEHGLEPGKWLHELKAAVVENAADDMMIAVSDNDRRPLSELRPLVTISRGQKIAYVTDVADTRRNRAAIAALAAEADLFFIEARFAAEDEQLARERAHLTTRASGQIANSAGVRRLEPFHFSPRYEGEEQRMLDEVNAAFTGKGARAANGRPLINEPGDCAGSDLSATAPRP
jgi:ribonuclease Z